MPRCGFALDRLRGSESGLLTQLGTGSLELCPKVPIKCILWEV